MMGALELVKDTVERGNKMVIGSSLIGLGLLVSAADGPFPALDVIGIPLVLGGVGVLGVDLMGMAKKNPALTDQQKVLLGVGAVGLLWYMKRKGADDELVAMQPPADLVKPTFTAPDKPGSGLPPADLAPGGAAGAAAPGESPSAAAEPGVATSASTKPTNPFAIPTPRGQAVPGEDTNLWHYPMEDPNLGATDSWIAWATGAGEGEGYLPDSWGPFGSKKQAKAAATEVLETGARAAGAGAAQAAGYDEDEKLVPKWVVPTLAVGSLALGGLYIWRSTR